ncbi:D-2-hydroxyacid dehydrogenase [Paenibacillus alvei]
MKKQKLLITRQIEDNLVKQIQEAIPDWDIIMTNEPEQWKLHVQDTTIILGWRKFFEDSSMNALDELKWVQTWSAGVNSIPLKDLEGKDITITSANGVHSFPISETVFALMLSLTRNIHTYIKNQVKKKWDGADIKLEMHGKTVGVIGVGAIGKETAKLAKAFGMKVIGIRHSGKPENYVDEMYTTDMLNEVLPECDYVVITLPLTEDTYHLFTKEQFQLMKNSAFLINIGRGEIIKEADLAAALSAGEILGAGLDVFEKEPLEESSSLWEMDNVIITPHTSGSTEHYDKRVVEDIFIPNLKRFLAEKKLEINVVDYKKGY